MKFTPTTQLSGGTFLHGGYTEMKYARYTTLFFKGPYSVIGFYEVMRMFLISLMHFLR